MKTKKRKKKTKCEKVGYKRCKLIGSFGCCETYTQKEFNKKILNLKK
jgi:hypothetical protein